MNVGGFGTPGMLGTCSRHIRISCSSQPKVFGQHARASLDQVCFMRPFLFGGPLPSQVALFLRVVYIWLSTVIVSDAPMCLLQDKRNGNCNGAQIAGVSSFFSAKKLFFNGILPCT